MRRLTMARPPSRCLGTPRFPNYYFEQPLADENARSSAYDIRADLVKNRLYLRLAGFLSDTQAREIANKIIEEAGKLKPGFDVINDIRELKPTTPSVAEELKRAQGVSKDKGHRRVIRVVGQQAVTQLQWNRTLQEATGARAEVAPSVEEAERMLEQDNES